jgi:hypothetical protein
MQDKFVSRRAQCCKRPNHQDFRLLLGFPSQSIVEILDLVKLGRKKELSSVANASFGAIFLIHKVGRSTRLFRDQSSHKDSNKRGKSSRGLEVVLCHRITEILFVGDKGVQMKPRGSSQLFFGAGSRRSLGGRKQNTVSSAIPRSRMLRCVGNGRLHSFSLL